MWLVTVLLQGEAQPTNLQYTAVERARAATDEALGEAVGSPASPRVTVTDDFSRSLTFDRAVLVKVLFQNFEEALRGDRAVQLMAARANAQLSDEAMKDPAIRLAKARQNGGGLALPPGARLA